MNILKYLCEQLAKKNHLTTLTQASVKGHTAQLEGVLGQANELREELGELLNQLEEMRGRLKNHAPPRVAPPNIEKQMEALSVSVTLMFSCLVGLTGLFILV